MDSAGPAQERSEHGRTRSAAADVPQLARDAPGPQLASTLGNRTTRKLLNRSPNAEVDRVVAAPGRPLGRAVRREMEAAFGWDLSGVRVHGGSDAMQSADTLDARAYTIGRHVALGRGQRLASAEGQRTLAHELAHVIQQSRPGRTTSPAGHDAEASAAAERVAAGAQAEVRGASGVSLALDKKKKGKKGKKGKKPSGGAAAKPAAAKPAASPKGEPRGSATYKESELRGKGSTDWRKERARHTKAAGRKASKAASEATGRPKKVTGKGTEYHHHADVKEAKRLNLNPNVAGESERMSAVKSRRSKQNYGQVGDEPGKGKKLTHHNTAKAIDKAEQQRTAKAIRQQEGKAPGKKPNLPRGPKGRAGLVDASGTSKWRLPATADQAERAKEKWVRKPPAGAPVDKTGRVIKPGGAAGAPPTPQAPAPAKPAPAAGGPPGPARPAAPLTPARPLAGPASPVPPSPAPAPAPAAPPSQRAPIVQSPGVAPSPTAARPSPAAPPPSPTPTPSPAGPRPSPAAAPASPPTKAPSGAGPVVPGAAKPGVAPLKAGLKGGLKAGGGMLMWAALGYIVNKKLEADLERDLGLARKGFHRAAQRHQAENPGQPVYLKITVRSEDFSRYIPLMGWIPESPMLGIWKVELTTTPIDSPIVKVDDHRLEFLHPGIAREVTYTELIAP